MTHIQTLQKKLGKSKLDAILISSSYNIAYLTGFFGFSRIEREGYMLVTKNHTYFFASGLNSEAVEKHIRQAGFEQTSLVTISPRIPLTKKALFNIIRKEKLKRLGFEKHHLTFAEYERLKSDLVITLVPTENLVEEKRMIKTADEIAAIEKACKLGDKAFDYIRSKIKTGITEKELAWQLELFIRNSGAEISFQPIVAFGANSSIPHHVTNDQRLTHSPPAGGSGQATIILLDFGVKVDNFCSDMTRTVFFGKASTQQRRMYQIVLESQTRAIEFINHKSSIINHKGVNAKDVDKVARSYITSQHFPTIPHSLGHGIGLEVHEPPRLSIKSKDILKPGMVFSIEPGIYEADVGGVRIEDLVVLKPSGPRLLTKAKKDLIEV